MNELEKKAYAYATKRQEDPNYPVYNWETEITDAYEQGYKEAIEHPTGGELSYVLNKGCKIGYKDAVRKAYDWLIDRYENQGVILLEDINELKQVLEEQQ